MTVEPSDEPVRKRQPSWILGALAAVGIASIVLLVVSNLIRDRVIQREVALSSALLELRTSLALTHLWLEEYVTDDRDALGPSLDNERLSLEIVEAMLEGGSPLGTRFRLIPVDDPGLRARIVGVDRLLSEFQRLSDRRRVGYESGDDVGIGSEIDEEYDLAFTNLGTQLEQLDQTVQERVANAQRRARLLFRSLIVSWTLIVLLALATVWVHERRRLRAEAALAASQLQLFQAQKMEAVGQLAGGIAHDINNYLAAINAQCELVQMKPEQVERTRQKMATVQATTAKATALIRQLLAFSRRQPLRSQRVGLNQIVTGVGPIIDRLLGDDVVLETDLMTGLDAVRVDSSQLEQVVLNLAVNAREAMPAGGRLSVATGWAERPLSEGEPAVELTVADEGPRISPELRDRIFEPFYTTKDKAHGSGLGLATVYAIVEQSGGRIEVEDGPHGGALFRITLPSAGPAPATGEAPEIEIATTDGRSRRILLVEDNPEVRQSLHEALSALGHDVETAVDGFEAEERFGRGGVLPDLLITDVVMPGRSGKETVDRLLESHPSLRVLYVSGYPDDVLLRHGIREGSVEFLQKPFSLEQLRRKIEEIARPA